MKGWHNLWKNIENETLTHSSEARVQQGEQYDKPKSPDNSSTVLLVCNTHLFWDPDFDDVKLSQAVYFVQRITAARDNFFRQHPPAMPPITVPVVLCGDFNSMPAQRVHQFLADGMSRLLGYVV
jgi:mRNA deadenylase 3'-5' endonuclease subunit Ccr4